MAPTRKRGANNKGITGTELSLGDLVLAKVKGFPAWPAKISRPEEWERTPDPKKYFVQFFGTEEIAFVAPVDIQPFTIEVKKKLQAGSKGKTVKFFARALEEICEAFAESESNPDVSSALEGMKSNGLENDVGVNREVTGNASSRRSSLERCSNMQEGAPRKNISCASELGFSKKGVEKCSLTTSLHSDDATNGGKKDLSLCKDRIQSAGTSVSPYGGGGDLSDDLINCKRSPSEKQKSLSNGHRSKGFHSERKRKFDDMVHNDHAGDSGHLKDGILHPISSSKSDKHPSGYKVNRVMNGNKSHDIIKILREDAFSGSKEYGETAPPKQKSSNHMRSEKNPVGISVRSDSSKKKKPIDLVNGAHKQSSLKNEKRDSSTSHVYDGDLEKSSESKGSIYIKSEDHLLSKPQKCSNPSDVSPAEAVTSSVTHHHGKILNSMSNPIEPASDDKRSSLSSLRKSDATKKRRAIRLYDDNDDENEAPKTPIHGISARKLHSSSSIHESLQTKVQIQGNRLIGQTMKGSSKSGEALAKLSVPSSKSRGDSTSVALPEGLNKSEKVQSPSPLGLDSNKQMPVSSVVGFVSPKQLSPFVISAADKNLEEHSINKHQDKASGTISHSKGQTTSSKGLNLDSDGSSHSHTQVTNKKSKQLSSIEKPKVTPKSHGEGDNTVCGRLENLKKDRVSSLEDSKMDSELSMRNLIAAAQAKRKQAQIHNILQSNGATESPAFERQFLSGGSNLMQVGAQEIHIRTSFASPPGHVSQLVSQNQGIEEHDDKTPDEGHQGASGSLSGGTEAAVARDAFEGMIETLSRTKESIGRATRLAVDCAKYGIANEVVDLLVRKLESEPSFHRKVDIFFLVDSITQCSHNHKGIAGASYISAVQAALPRLLGAAAPAGPSARENRRQCLKVLRLWLERKILPESVLRRYMDDIGASNDDISSGISFRRPSRAERSVDDPIREMEGDMLVDEYGSNATFQLAGFFSSQAFVVDEEDEEDMLSTPCAGVGVELAETAKEAEACVVTPSERHHHILEDVDVELEMEDVSGHEKDGIALSTSWSSEINEHEQGEGVEREKNDARYIDSCPMTPEGSPPLPLEPPSPLPPLPASPPPPLPPSCPPSPPPPPPPPPAQPNLPSLPISGLSPPVHSPLPPQLPFPSQVPEEFRSMPGSQIIQMTGNAPEKSSRFIPAGNSGLQNPSSSMYIVSHPAQPNQQFQPSHTAFSQGPFHAITPHNIPTPSNHFPYNKTAVQQHLDRPHLHSYPSPSLGDNRMRIIADDHRRASGEYKADNQRAIWMNGGRTPSCSTSSYGKEGYHRPPPERPPSNNSGFQYSAPKMVVQAAAPIPGHGNSRMLPSRPDMSALNSWRPA